MLFDNTQTVSFLNRGLIRNPDALVWPKKLFEVSLNFNFRVAAVYSPGVLNVAADALSRTSE